MHDMLIWLGNNWFSAIISLGVLFLLIYGFTVHHGKDGGSGGSSGTPTGGGQ